ncbi:XAC2610-related protein [Mucilaginibacter litoreus]|uniref:XAC2610-related protein n=2 Tax=Mucilaginibacter litoreus TaxID=1048221 RepID=A0ABW3ARW0_9SPHI
MITAMADAKSFELISVDQSKPFSLRIYCTNEGKAALAQYKGKAGYLALRLKKFTTSVLKNTKKQPEGYYYEWDELVEGKATGSYGVVEQSGKVTDAWYMRHKDGMRFKLAGASKEDSRDEIQKYLLHNVLITFAWTSTDDQFMFTYPDGKIITPNFLSLDAPDARRSCYIKDFNFDGYDDVAFSVPDAGMGVYQTFNIWLYDVATKHFMQLKESQDARAKCSCLCDVTLNAKERLLYTACRGGARWWQDVYRISKNNQLIWLRSTEKNKPL